MMCSASVPWTGYGVKPCHKVAVRWSNHEYQHIGPFSILGSHTKWVMALSNNYVSIHYSLAMFINFKTLSQEHKICYEPLQDALWLSNMGSALRHLPYFPVCTNSHHIWSVSCIGWRGATSKWGPLWSEAWIQCCVYSPTSKYHRCVHENSEYPAHLLEL